MSSCKDLEGANEVPGYRSIQVKLLLKNLYWPIIFHTDPCHISAQATLVHLVTRFHCSLCEIEDFSKQNLQAPLLGHRY